MIYVGIDNGVTGAIGIIGDNPPRIFKTPVTLGFDFQKSGKQINRIDWSLLKALFIPYKGNIAKVAIERPFINPKFFNASVSAIRSFESWILFIEQELQTGYTVIDSKKWQKKYLPNVTGPALKKASIEFAMREQPDLLLFGKKIEDADAYWIARYIQSENQ